MKIKQHYYFYKDFRDVAQFGSAPVLGTGGRRFESCHPDIENSKKLLISEEKKTFSSVFYFLTYKKIICFVLMTKAESMHIAV